MASIGRAEYPELIPSDAFDIAEKMGKGSVKTANGLASVMGLGSTDSGYFYHRVAALTKYYGVVDRSKLSVSLTPLGERIAHPLSPEDRRLACTEAVGRVPLLKSLFAALGRNYHEADFRTKLRELTQASLPDIEKKAPHIERLYRDAIPYMASGDTQEALQNIAEATGTFADEIGRLHDAEKHELRRDLGPSEPGYRKFEGNGVYLRVRSDLDALEEADAIIRTWLERQKRNLPPEPQADRQ